VATETFYAGPMQFQVFPIIQWFLITLVTCITRILKIADISKISHSIYTKVSKSQEYVHLLSTVYLSIKRGTHLHFYPWQCLSEIVPYLLEQDLNV